MRRGSGVLLACVLAAGCGAPAFVNTAYYGDLRTLQKEIRSASASGDLDRASVLDLAEAVARRELRSAKGDVALERIRDARECPRAVEPELRERAESRDDAGAAALLVLMDAGRVAGEPMVDRYAHAASGAWRAVAARATGPRARGSLRRAFTIDPDERVRRQALRAAFDAADAADLPLLLEAARLDPDGSNRSLAIRAVGAIGGADAALALTDLWTSSDGPTRLGIVDAWAAPGVFPNGGARELLRVAESGTSLVAVAAGGALARIGRDGAREGRAVLVRAVMDGTTTERLVAIQLVPLAQADSLGALERAAKSDDLAVRVVAWARLLESPPRRRAALEALAETARGKDAAARQARVALAAAGDARAAPLLKADLTAGTSDWRQVAALGLFRLGRAADMAPALADEDSRVRMGVACSVLAARPESG